eukprot:1013544-Amorphochlora_amoeboformis.AAC.2
MVTTWVLVALISGMSVRGEGGFFPTSELQDVRELTSETYRSLVSGGVDDKGKEKGGKEKRGVVKWRVESWRESLGEGRACERGERRFISFAGILTLRFDGCIHARMHIDTCKH